MEQEDMALTVWTDLQDLANRVLWKDDKAYSIPAAKAIHFVRQDLKESAFDVAMHYESSEDGHGRTPDTFLICCDYGMEEKPEDLYCLHDSNLWHEVLFLGSSAIEELGMPPHRNSF